MKSLSLRNWAPWFLGLTGGALAMVGTSRAFDWPLVEKVSSKTSSVPVTVSETPVQRDNRFSTSFAPVVKKAAPSVVNIFTSKTVKAPRGMPFFFDDPMFREFFGDRFGGAQPRSRKQTSLGSGVIVTKEGHILTNNHVVDEADTVKVALAANGNKQYTAKIVGRDPKTDIALLKIDAEDLPAITLADSDKIEVGDIALAIGNPFGIGQTVTQGIISAVGRGGMGIEDYEDFIQTDAAINPGNSGGALVDAEGRLIGINTAILSRTGGNQGIGFAVPINLARQVMDSLLQHGRVSRGLLGVRIQDLTPELAKEFKVEEGKGVLVADVEEKSAAEAAGIKSGDVIIEVNGKSVENARRLQLLIAGISPGSNIKVKVMRDGKERTLTAVLKEMKSDKDSEDQVEDNGSGEDALDGVTVADITAAARKQGRIPANLNGALITEVDPDSAAAAAGLRAGDVILELNRKPITSAEDAVEASKGLGKKLHLLRIWRNGASIYITVDETPSKGEKEEKEEE